MRSNTIKTVQSIDEMNDVQMIEVRVGLLSVFLHSPRVLACLEDLPSRHAQTVVDLLCNLMLKHRGLSHNSAILRSDSP